MGFLIFILILFGIPALEIYVMIEVGSEIGALQTVGLILLTAAMGGVLFRVQGLSTLRRVQAHLDAKEMPVGDLLSGVGILLAALLLYMNNRQAWLGELRNGVVTNLVLLASVLIFGILLYGEISKYLS